MNAISPTDQDGVDFLNKMAELAGSVDADSRAVAEKNIKDYQNCIDQQQGFLPLLLNVAVAGLPSSAFSSIVLKNTVKTCWNASSAEHCVTEGDKALIREIIIPHMLTASGNPIVQRNLGEAIACIATVDFPSQWPRALYGIVETLNGEFMIDSHSTALSVAHSILVKYRALDEMDDALRDELRHIYSTFLKPFLNAMDLLTASMYSPECTQPALRKCLEGFTAGVECILDVSQIDVGDEFLWSLDKFVQLFLRALSYPLASAAAHLTTAVEMKSTVLTCVKHFLDNFDEDFKNYAGEFVKVVWDMIAEPSSSETFMDDVVVCGMALLSSACRGTTHHLFDNIETLSLLLHQVAVPNILLTQEEAELFDSDPDVYIQRDIEGSDFHTRRRAASDIVRTLVVSFPDKARPLLLEETTRLFAAAATDWRAKDAAIYIASSLALDGKRADAQRGAVMQQLGSIIPFETLVQNTILPELVSDISACSPYIIKADCIRFVATFRVQMSPFVVPLIPVLGKWILCTDRIVSAYAAHALDKLISTRVPDGLQNLITADALRPHAGSILKSLCTKVSEAVPNTFHAQCLVHILVHAPSVVEGFTNDIAAMINQGLTAIVKNPSNPVYSYYLFDALSRCIALQNGDTKTIEHLLYGNLIYILANDVLEYVPYALQLFAQLVDSQTGALPEHYQGLVAPLLQPALFTHKGTIPAAGRLLVSFIEKFPHFLISQGQVESVLNVVRILVHLKNYDHVGLTVLTTMMLSFPAEALGAYMVPVYQLLLQRLQQARTPKFVRIFIIFLSVAVIVRGPEDLAITFGAIQPGLFQMVLDRVWLANMQKVTGELERKACVVAMTNLLCDSEVLHSDPKVWSCCVFRCFSMICNAAEQDDHQSFSPTTAVGNDIPMGKAEFSNLFCPLEAAVHPPVDVCQSISNPVQYFKDRLCGFLRGKGEPLQAALPMEVLGLLNN